MKKLFLFLLAFISLSASAQIYQAQNGYGFQYKRLKIDSTLHVPTFNGTPNLRNSVDSGNAAIAFDSANNKVYFYNPKTKTWSIISASASDITGLISAGSNITITGTGTSADPYVINSSGGGSGNTKYILQGYGIIIDSPDVNHYVINIDTTIKSPINVVKPIKAIDSTTIGLDSQYVRDTSLNLAGGTTGQVLKKNSSTNGDWSWQDESGGTWGSITGTLSDQTDLQAALNAKQATLVSGTNIKTINGSPVLGSGNLTITGVDSSAVHPSGITTSGDTALVFSDLYGNTSTVSFSFSQYWKKNGNNLYYPTGNVNIGLGTKPAGLLSLVSNPISSTSVVDDTTGLILKDSANATVGNPATVSLPIVLWAKSYNVGAAASQNARFKIQAQATGTATPSGNLYWYFSSNDANYTQLMQLSNQGNLTVTGSLTTSGVISAGNAISGSNLNLSRSYSSSGDYQSLNMTDNISGIGTLKTYRALWIHPTISNPVGTYSKSIETSVGDIALNTISGNVIIGKDTADNANKLSIVSTESFFGLPSMTSAQRDSVYTTFTGTLAGGSGYTNNTFRIPLSGGSGTGAEAEIVISGGVVTSFRLTKPGKRYKIGDVLSSATNIGAGTGFSYTITALAPPRGGSCLFNTTTGTAQYWNGTTWIDF